MSFPFVAVTLPDDTPPPYVAGLLSACTQAYHEGTCETAGGRPPPARSEAEETPGSTGTAAGGTPSSDAEAESQILADVRWEDTTTAILQLGLPHWRDHRWLTRTITFKEHDHLVERYRAIGFTIGSLSITVAEVARLEREARETARETQGGPESTAPSAAPSTEPPSPSAPTPTSSEPIPLEVPTPVATPSNWFVSGYVAGELGEGFDAIRRGGTLGVGIYGQQWGCHVSGYYTDASGNGLTAALSGVELKLDLRLTAKVLETRLSVGAGYGHLDAKVTKAAADDFATGVVAVNIRPSQWAVAPFLGVGARIFRGFTTDVPELDDLGPVAPYVQLGVTFNTPHRSP